ncbi:4-diphosphocytidyl-2-C-methyl-D-erythritol kinase chloroplastic, partial [Bienertia sinuspersici]
VRMGLGSNGVGAGFECGGGWVRMGWGLGSIGVRAGSMALLGSIGVRAGSMALLGSNGVGVAGFGFGGGGVLVSNGVGPAGGSTIVGIGSPDPPQFIYDDEAYKDVFLSEATFITREQNQWYSDPTSSSSNGSVAEFSRPLNDGITQ